MRLVIRITLLLLVGSLALSACSLLSSKPDPGELTSTAVALTPTAMPATPTPLTPTVVLVAPPDANQHLSGEFEREIRALAEVDGLRFQIRPSLASGDLTPEMKIVVALAPDIGISALAQAAPDTHFISVGMDEITATDNLSVLRSRTYDIESLAFIAGFIAGVITPDWRAGILLPAEQNSAALMEQAYRNGLHYWCGLCQPSYAPFIIYPQSSQVSDPTDAVAALSTVDTLVNLGVQTIYVPAEVSTIPLLEYITEKQLMMIGVTEPPASAAGLWVVSLRTGNLLDNFGLLWEKVSSGEPGIMIEVPLDLMDTGSGILEESRQRVIRQMLDELSTGLIHPGLVTD
ncbi:MAG: hypothetical protein JW704_13500 [Anaerolineaceae bacterium]|nr:hypothetical protein [Anaerolineaceae bacterium]MBN2677533.1 hypothetical protein [Anaerolineaceae bacterium]